MLTRLTLPKLTRLSAVYGGGLALVIGHWVSNFLGHDTITGYVILTPSGLRRRWMR